MCCPRILLHGPPNAKEVCVLVKCHNRELDLQILSMGYGRLSMEYGRLSMGVWQAQQIQTTLQDLKQPWGSFASLN